jgi:CheY-like chemotaxis protein
MLSTRTVLPSGCRILIVDDSRDITELLCEYFNGIGAVACAVNDGRSALLRLQLQRFDALIVDLIMPGISGWDILKFAMKSKSDLHSRTIVVTGDRYRLRQSSQVSLLPAVVVYKPFQLDDLRRAVCKIIELSAAMSA